MAKAKKRPAHEVIHNKLVGFVGIYDQMLLQSDAEGYRRMTVEMNLLLEILQKMVIPASCLRGFKRELRKFASIASLHPDLQREIMQTAAKLSSA